MSRPVEGLAVAGIGSSMMSSKSTRLHQMPALQRAQNAAPVTYVPPHLRPAAPEVQGSENKYQSGSIPPHLRGFNTPLKDFPAAAQESAIPVVKPLFKAALEEFAEPILKQDADAEIGRKSAEKVYLTPAQAQLIEVEVLTTGGQQTQSGAHQAILQPARSKFRQTKLSDQAMQAFLAKQIGMPPTNGKKYVYTGGQESPKIGGVGSKLNPTLMEIQVNAPRSDVPSSTHLNADALVEADSISRQSSGGFAYQISDTGVGDNPKENIRATQGRDAQKELQDWNGTMLPPPVDWETDRGTFDNSFMRRYIRGDWLPKCGDSVGFDSQFINPPKEEPTIPNYAHSSNERKQRFQTAKSVSEAAVKKWEKKDQNLKALASAHEVHNFGLASKVPEPHPYAPTTDLYLRPAAKTDLKGIADIYNYYALGPHSIVTEDQAAISQEDVAFLINHTKGEKLPFIVAVRGRIPLSSHIKLQNRAQEDRKSSLLQFEGIIGFAYAETYYYGLGGFRSGRSRFTHNIHFYVHPEYTGKKVGRSLLDRMIQSLSHGYGAKDGYDWLNPDDDPVYKAGGVQKCHQIVIQFAAHSNDDPNYKRLKDFLTRYFFEEEGRIRRIARSSVNGPDSPKFVDIVFFVKEASPSTEFSPVI